MVTLDEFVKKFDALIEKYKGAEREDGENFPYLHGFKGIQEDPAYQELEGDAAELFYDHRVQAGVRHHSPRPPALQHRRVSGREGFVRVDHRLCRIQRRSPGIRLSQTEEEIPRIAESLLLPSF